MSSRLWVLMASPAADWPPLPRAAEVERGVTVSPARYMYGCARLSGIRGETLQRGEKRSTSDDEPETDRQTHSRDLDIYPAAVHSSATAAGARSGSTRTPYYTLFHQQQQQQRGAGEKKKVWRNAVSVPAPDQPAVCLQQPAPSPADGGLLVRSDAPARRLLQLRHRYVHGSHRPIYCHKRLCFISLFSILLSLFLWEHVGIRVDTRGRTDLQSVHSVHSSSRYTSWSWDVWGHFSSNFYAFSQVSTPEHHIKALSTM